MVAIVSGNNLGLSLGSQALLGQQGALGSATQGRQKERVYVNASSGNLVIQNIDDLLVGRGPDIASLRTYNSFGVLSDALRQDDNQDRWRLGFQKRIIFASGALSRVDGDGAESAYTYDAATSRYKTKEGDGAFDSIVQSATGGIGNAASWVWTDGATQVQETYDVGTGRLLSAKDAIGQMVSYVYDGAGNVTSATFSNGEQTIFNYSASNQLLAISTKDALGNLTGTRTRYSYDAAGRLSTITVDLSPADSSITDGKTYVTTYAYTDASSRLIASMTQTDGTNLAFSYVTVNGQSRINSFTETVATGVTRTTSFAYDTPNNRTTITDPLGVVTTLEYDASGQLKKVTVPSVNGSAPAERSYTYDADGNVATVADGLGQVITYQYDANGNQLLQRDAAGNTVSRVFGSRNELKSETFYRIADPDGAGALQPSGAQTTQYFYDATLNLRFVVSPEGRVTEHRYDGFGQRTLTMQIVGMTYLPLANATTATVAADVGSAPGSTSSVLSEMAYDASGQLSSMTTYGKASGAGVGTVDADKATTQYIYDPAGQLTSSISSRSYTSSWVYDGLGRVLSATDAAGRVTTTLYDDAGAKTLVRFANGLASLSSYDRAGQLVSVAEGPNNGTALTQTLSQTSYVYDADGRLRMVVDPMGRRQHMLYDAAGRKIADIDADGSLTEHVYNANGLEVRTVSYSTRVNLSLIVDASGNLLASAPTLASLRPATNANDRTQRFYYDTANRLVKSVDEANFVTETIYDGSSRVTDVIRYATVLSAAAITALTDSAAPAAPAASNDDRRVKRFYDNDGLLRGTVDGERYLSENKYDSAGRLVETIRYNTQLSVGEATGAALVIPALSGADIHEYFYYDASSRLVASVDGERFLVERTLDKEGRLTGVKRYKSGIGAGITVSSASVVSTLVAGVTAGGFISESYTYDALGRLDSEIDRQGTVTKYTYNTAGNLTKTERGYGTAELRALTKTYDLQGRLVGELNAEGTAALAATTTQAQIDAIWASNGIAYTYDASGLLTSRAEAGRVTRYYYDVDRRLRFTVNAMGEIAETRYNALNQVTETIRYSTRLSAPVLSGLSATSQIDALLTASNSGDSHVVTEYFQTGTVKQVTDAEGFLTTFGYNAFREVSQSSRQVSSTLDIKTQTDLYDRRGLLTKSIWDPAGLNVANQTVYDAFGRAVTLIDGRNKSSTQAYDKRGRLVHFADQLNHARDTSYDVVDRVLVQTTQIDALTSAQTSFVYDDAARTMTMSMQTASNVNIVVVTSYNRHGQSVKVRDDRLNEVVYEYNKDGKLTKTTTDAAVANQSHLNLIESKAYDGANRLVTEVDANGVTTVYTYDAANRVLTRAVDPHATAGDSHLDIKTVYEYDGKGQTVKITDPNQVVTTYAFDRKGQLKTRVVDAGNGPTNLNLTTLFDYDGTGNTVKMTDPRGIVTKYEYDKLGRRFQETLDPIESNPTGLNYVTRYKYDENNNVVVTIRDAGNANPALHRVTRYLYDDANRLTHTYDPAGGLRTLEYDAANRIVRKIAYSTPVSLPANEDALGAPIAAATSRTDAIDLIQYDLAGRVVAEAKALSIADDTAGAATKWAVTTFVNDGNGNVTTRTHYAAAVTKPRGTTIDGAAGVAAAVQSSDTNNRVERMVYDADNRLTFAADGARAVTSYLYDGNGNVVRKTRHINLIGTSASPSAVSIDDQYDRSERMVYDANNRMIFNVDAAGAVTRHAYDANGNETKTYRYSKFDSTFHLTLATATVPNSTALLYDNTLQGRLNIQNLLTAWEVRADDRIEDRVFDHANRVAYHIDALGYVVGYSYNANGQATGILRYGTAAAAPSASSAWTITSFTAPATNASLDRSEAFTFDYAGRLKTSTDALGFQEAYDYDALGNKKTFTNKNGAVWTYGYDAASRLITETSPSVDLADPRLALAANDTLARSALTNASNYVQANVSLVTENHYDALGNLVSRTEAKGTANERTTQWQYDAAGRQVKTIYPRVGVYNAAVDAGGSLATKVTIGFNAAADVGTQALSLVNLYAGIRLQWENEFNLRFHVYADGSYGAPDLASNPNNSQYAVGWAALQASLYGFFTQNADPQKYVPVGTTVFWGEGVLTKDSDSISNGQGGMTNGSASYWVMRRETQSPAPLESTVTYNAFDEAVSNTDAAGQKSYKVYDGAGRVRYEIDAEGFVTRYDRDAFGGVSIIRRYEGQVATVAGVALSSLDEVSLSSAETNMTTANTSAVLASASRIVYTGTFDRLGRSTLQRAIGGSGINSSAVDDQLGVSDQEYQSVYNAFGELVQRVQTARRTAGNQNVSWQSTTYFYDKLGQNVGQIDPLGYYTAKSYDAVGNLVSQTEYASALSPSLLPGVATDPSLWSNASTRALFTVAPSPASITTSVSDRRTDYGYNKKNQKISETKVGVQVSSVNVQGQPVTTAKNVRTSFEYDHVGNLTRTIAGQMQDASSVYVGGQSTYSLYDALGRVTAVASPAANGGAGSTATAFKRDAMGNVVERVDYASSGTVSNTPQVLTGGYSLSLPVDTTAKHAFTQYDAAGRAIREVDAAGQTKQISYDAAGRVAKVWRIESGISSADSTKRSFTAAAEATTYDKLGHVVSKTTSDYELLTSSSATTFVEQSAFNAYGEMTRHGVNDTSVSASALQEYFDYDSIGNLWRTNSGDGVDRIYLYDSEGNRTAELRSEQTGLIRQAGNIEAAMTALNNTPTVVTYYDKVGNPIAQRRLALTDTEALAQNSTDFLRASINTTQGNKVTLYWSSLLAAGKSLGGGSVRVELEYSTAPTANLLDNDRTVVREYNAMDALAGVTVDWSDANGAIVLLRHVRVWKKDINGNYWQIIDRANNFSGDLDGQIVGASKDLLGGRLYFDAPPNPTTPVTIKYRLKNTATWNLVEMPTNLTQAMPAINSGPRVANFGDALMFDVGNLAFGTYEYQIHYSSQSVAAGASAAQAYDVGEFSRSAPTLQTIAGGVSVSSSSPTTLRWAAAPAGATTVFRYRLSYAYPVDVNNPPDPSKVTNMYQAFDNFFQYFPEGHVLSWAGGTLTRGPNNTGVYVRGTPGNANYVNYTMNQSGGMLKTAAECAAIRQFWETEWGVKFISGFDKPASSFSFTEMANSFDAAFALVGTSGYPIKVGDSIANYLPNGTLSFQSNASATITYPATGGGQPVSYTLNRAGGPIQALLQNIPGLRDRWMWEYGGYAVAELDIKAFLIDSTRLTMKIGGGTLTKATANATVATYTDGVGGSIQIDSSQTLGAMASNNDNLRVGLEAEYGFKFGGAWKSISGTDIKHQVDGSFDGVDLANLPADNITYEVLWTRAGSDVPTDHATGTVTVNRKSTPFYIPALNASVSLVRNGAQAQLQFTLPIGSNGYQYRVQYKKVSDPGNSSYQWASLVATKNPTTGVYSVDVSSLIPPSGSLAYNFDVLEYATQIDVAADRHTAGTFYLGQTATTSINVSVDVPVFAAAPQLVSGGSAGSFKVTWARPASAINGVPPSSIGAIFRYGSVDAAGNFTPNSLTYYGGDPVLPVTVNGGNFEVDVSSLGDGTADHPIPQGFYIEYREILANGQLSSTPLAQRMGTFAVTYPSYASETVTILPNDMLGAVNASPRLKQSWETEYSTTFTWTTPGWQPPADAQKWADMQYFFNAYFDTTPVNTVLSWMDGTLTRSVGDWAYYESPYTSGQYWFSKSGGQLKVARENDHIRQGWEVEFNTSFVWSNGGWGAPTDTAKWNTMLSQYNVYFTNNTAPNGSTISWKGGTLTRNNYTGTQLLFNGYYYYYQNYTVNSGTWFYGGTSGTPSLSISDQSHTIQRTTTYTGSYVATSDPGTAPAVTPGSLSYLYNTSIGNGISLAYSESGNILTSTSTKYAGAPSVLRTATPRVTQDVDRWGNVVNVGDARNTAWKTRYEYDANGKLQRVIQPGANGVGDGPTTNYYYDEMGRLIATQDARGQINRFEYDGAGNVLREIHADGGIVSYEYDSSGNRTKMTAAELLANGQPNVTTYAYDALNRLIETTHSQVKVVSTNVFLAKQFISQSILSEKYEYDEAGNRTREIRSRRNVGTNGTLGSPITDAETRYRYDARGNLIETMVSNDNATLSTKATYDRNNRKISETDADGNTASWRYDDFGRLRADPGTGTNDARAGHIDLDGAYYFYTYDAKGQLKTQKSSRGQDLSFDYDANGNVTRVQKKISSATDNSSTLWQVTRYEYDEAGRRVHETTVEEERAGLTYAGALNKSRLYQDNHQAYDELGRLRDVRDSRYHVILEYDAVGNRTHMQVQYRPDSALPTDAPVVRDYYYAYDAMNRQILVDGVSAYAGTLTTGLINSRQGHLVTYDKNGNRLTDTSVVKKVSAAGADSNLPQDTVVVKDSYTYDALNRIKVIARENLTTGSAAIGIDVREYDGASRQVTAGPGTIQVVQNLGTEMEQEVTFNVFNVQSRDFYNSMGVTGDTRINQYDRAGRLIKQLDFDVSATAGGSTSSNSATRLDYLYDNTGHTSSMTLNLPGANPITYNYLYDKKFDSKKLTTTTVATTAGNGTQNSNKTIQRYDVNGELIAIDQFAETTANSSSPNPANTDSSRVLVNDVAGRALATENIAFNSYAAGKLSSLTAGQKVTHRLIVNGEVMAETSDVEGDAKSQFNFGYRSVDNNYPAAAPGAYSVVKGDTLYTVARAVWGDSSLWYLIAEANGVNAPDQLIEGQVLVIPSRPGAVHNSADTVVPYDPSRIVGDTTPYITPQAIPVAQSGGCGAGQILVAIVAIAVTVATQGATSEFFAAQFGASAGEAAVATSAVAEGVANGAQLAGAIAGAATSAAIGSAVAQGVAIGIGIQDQFSWRQVGVAAVTAGATQGLAPEVFAATGGVKADFSNLLVRGALNNAVGQGVRIAMGVQSGFNWKQVAGSAFAQPVVEQIGKTLASTPFAEANPLAANVLTRSLQGAVSQGIVTRFTGGKFEAANIVSDAFGNLFGGALAQSGRGQQEAAYLQEGNDAFDAEDASSGEGMRQMLAMQLAEKAYGNGGSGGSAREYVGDPNQHDFASWIRAGSGADGFDEDGFDAEGDDQLLRLRGSGRMSASEANRAARTSLAENEQRIAQLTSIVEQQSRLNSLKQDQWTEPMDVFDPVSLAASIATPVNAAVYSPNSPNAGGIYIGANGALTLDITTRSAGSASEVERVAARVIGGGAGAIRAIGDTFVGTATFVANAGLSALSDQSNGYLGSKFELFRNAEQATRLFQQGVVQSLSNPRVTATNLFEHISQREDEAAWYDLNNNPGMAAQIRGGMAASAGMALLGGPRAVLDVAKVGNAAITGAAGRIGANTGLHQTGARQILNPSSLRSWDLADDAYASIRASAADVAKISENTGWSESRVARIKEHVFFKEHQLDSGVRRFDADPDIVNAWNRLTTGDHVSADINLLRHEIFESKFEGIFKTNYRAAHAAAIRAGRNWTPE